MQQRDYGVVLELHLFSARPTLLQVALDDLLPPNSQRLAGRCMRSAAGQGQGTLRMAVVGDKTESVDDPWLSTVAAGNDHYPLAAVTSSIHHPRQGRDLQSTR